MGFLNGMAMQGLSRNKSGPVGSLRTLAVSVCAREALA